MRSHNCPHNYTSSTCTLLRLMDLDHIVIAALRYHLRSSSLSSGLHVCVCGGGGGGGGGVSLLQMSHKYMYVMSPQKNGLK